MYQSRYKDSSVIDFDTLQQKVAQGATKPIRAEKYGLSLVKLTMSGDIDYIVEVSTDLRCFLHDHSIVL